MNQKTKIVRITTVYGDHFYVSPADLADTQRWKNLIPIYTRPGRSCVTR